MSNTATGVPPHFMSWVNSLHYESSFESNESFMALMEMGFSLHY